MVFGFIFSNTYAKYFYASVIYKLEKVENHNVNLELIFNENLTLIIVNFNA